MSLFIAIALVLLSCGSPVLAEATAHRVLAPGQGPYRPLLRRTARPAGRWSAGTTRTTSICFPAGTFAPHRGTRVVETDAGQEGRSGRYDAKPKEGYTGGVEVHAFQRLADGNTMVAESGNRRIVEVSPEGKIVREVPLKVENPHPHRDTRMVRKLDGGNYLVCQGGRGAFTSMPRQGRSSWTYRLDLAGRPRSDGHGPEGHGTEVYGAAARLKNGNTLIACRNGNRVIEVTPEGKTVWSVEQKELPGITLGWVTTLHALPNGNVIFGNCHAGPENPQLVEVTRDKQVVWTFKDFKRFGNSLAVAHVLDLPEGTIRLITGSRGTLVGECRGPVLFFGPLARRRPAVERCLKECVSKRGQRAVCPPSPNPRGLQSQLCALKGVLNADSTKRTPGVFHGSPSKRLSGGKGLPP